MMQAWNEKTPTGGYVTNGDAYDLALPKLPEGFEHLPAFLSDCGVYMVFPDGVVPLTYTEINAWAKSQNFTLSPLESQSMREMSVAYVSVAIKENPDCPIQDEDSQIAIDEARVSMWKRYAQKG